VRSLSLRYPVRLFLSFVLILLAQLGASAQAVTVRYTYDGDYNRLTEKTTNSSGQLIGNKRYRYDGNGRLTSVEDLLDPAQTETYSHDANGNQTGKAVGTRQTTYSYDARDQLTGVQESGGSTPLSTRYRYNADGMRTDVTENGQHWKYSWDGDRLVLSREPDGSLSRYQWGPRRLASLLSQPNGQSQRDWYLFDGLGSVAALISEEGAVSASYRFDAFGEVLSQQGESRSRFGFTGHQRDAATDLYYFKARYYAADQGRFISSDSYDGTTDTPESRNHYLYAYANPTVYIDLTGYWACPADVMADGCDDGTGALNIKKDKELAAQRARLAETQKRVEEQRAELGRHNETETARYIAGCKSNGGCPKEKESTRSEGLSKPGAGYGDDVAAEVQHDLNLQYRGIQNELQKSGAVLLAAIPMTKVGGVIEGVKTVDDVAEALKDPVRRKEALAWANANKKEAAAKLILQGVGRGKAAGSVAREERAVVATEERMTKRSADGRLRNPDGTFAYDGGIKRESNPLHGNTKTPDTTATLYGKFDAEGNFLKWGKSQDPQTRYTSKELNGGFIKEYRTGPTDEILDRERRLVERFPGPDNNEPWAGIKRPK
jgi:RHS repeat-associated protein